MKNTFFFLFYVYNSNNNNNQNIIDINIFAIMKQILKNKAILDAETNKINK